MIAPVSVPIYVDLEVSEAEFDCDIGLQPATDAELDTNVVVRHIEGGGLPEGGVPGDILIKRSDGDYDAEWVPPANSAEQDNTRPITAAAVYTEIGNINALLATI